MHPDFIILNARLATMDATGTEAGALAALHGRIVAISDDAAIRDLAGPGTTILNAEGRRVLPGIVDSHAHPDAYALRLRAWTLVSPDIVQTRDALLALIRARCEAVPPGHWCAFYRLNERACGGYPTLTELDAASLGRPIFILRTDGHLGLANSAAFAACGVTADTPDPAFGRANDRPGYARPLQGGTDPAPRWSDIEDLQRQGLPVVLKGILHPDDAARAAAIGCPIICSNHGGRQMESNPASFTALPRVVDAARGRVPVLMDGGIRRGEDVVKALAAGAAAVLVARPAAWALAAGGAEGVRAMLDRLVAELATAMRLVGAERLDQVDRALLG